MPRHWVVVSVCASVLLVGLVAATPAAALGAGGPAHVAFVCTSPAPDVSGVVKDWAAGRTEHIRGWTATYTSTGDPLCAGIVSIVANIEVTPGRGGIEGTVVYDLAGVDGGWTGTFHQVWAFPSELTSGREVARGFGALAGWQLRAVLSEALDGTITETDEAFAPGA